METGTRPYVEEYQAFRSGELSVRLEGWTVVHLTGPDTAAFLQGLASQDLAPDASCRTYFLTEKGRPVAVAWVRVMGDGASAWVVADEGARDLLIPHFERFRVMEEVEFEVADGTLVVLGSAARSAHAVRPQSGAGVPGPEGVRIDTAPLSLLLVSPGAAPPRLADPAVFEPWRIAAGLPRTGVDFDLDRIVTELADPGAISLTKGCYVGQEVVARTSNRGQVRRRRVGFRFDGAAGNLAPRAEIRGGAGVAGFVTSSALEAGTPEGVGMGYVAAEALASGSELLAVQGSTTIPLRISP